MPRETIIIATANSHRGELLRGKSGLRPFDEVDVLLLQEVNRGRDNLERRLADSGLSLVNEATDLAIAVRKPIGVVSTRTDCIQPRRFVQENHMMIGARLQTASGIPLVVATAHPDVPLRAKARISQTLAINRSLGQPFYDGNLVVAGDFNYFPRPNFIDERIRARGRLTPVDLGRPTYPLSGSIHRWLGRIGFPDGEMDAVMLRGEGISVEDVRVEDLQSDHRGIVVVFSLQDHQKRVKD